MQWRSPSRCALSSLLWQHHPPIGLRHLSQHVSQTDTQVGASGSCVPPIVFSTKAKTLQALRGKLTSAALCDQWIVSAADWKDHGDDIVRNILRDNGNSNLIVRSSASNEDTAGSSMAGAYLSLGNIAPVPEDLQDAIGRVFASYDDNDDDDNNSNDPSRNSNNNKDEEVLVQPMVANVVLSGVALTRELDSGSPYYVINYDDCSGRTDTVTGGQASTTTMLVRRAAAGDRLRGLSSSSSLSWMRPLIDSIVEVEDVTGNQELDIEFCVVGGSAAEHRIYILQVRPLAASGKWTVIPDAEIDGAIDKIRQDLAGRIAPQSGLAGGTTIFTEMTDWNPAEMIGKTPRPLALSLYKSLITDSIWAKARHLMGYRMVDGPLMVDFHGRPFIDVRKSFNSFLPAGIDDDIDDDAASKLINHQLSRLAENPGLHDKVEFDICVTCMDFSVAESRKRFADAGLTATQAHKVETLLTALTRDAIVAGAPRLDELIKCADHLLGDRVDLANIPPLLRISKLLETCREEGTLIFAQLARHAFISSQLLHSMVHEGIMGKADMDRFMQSIHTVATSLSDDLHVVSTGELDRDTFLKKYGHLRPNTYDITSWSYDERPELFLGHAGTSVAQSIHEPFEVSPDMKWRVEEALKGIGYDVTAEHLFDYISTAIRGREQSKFAFTKVVSDILSSLIDWGETSGFDRDDLSFLSIEDTLSGCSIEEKRGRMEAAKAAYDLTRAIQLPHVIVAPDDVDFVRLPLGQPNFITNKSVTAATVFLTSVEAREIDDRIVMIENADPGFDWIFSRPIRGLVTMYGGANSHMAIRCAEFGLPAAIGCGGLLFNQLKKASVVELNAATKSLSCQDWTIKHGHAT